jgi:hypothetical protein
VIRVTGSPLLEIARVLVCFDQVASFIINANHSIMCERLLIGETTEANGLATIRS